MGAGREVRRGEKRLENGDASLFGKRNAPHVERYFLGWRMTSIALIP